jgi:hypothetical protein
MTIALQRLAGDRDETGLLQELEITAMRQAKIGGGPIGVVQSSADNPIPFHDPASTLRVEAERELRTWGILAATTFTHLKAKQRTPREYAAWLAKIPGLLANLDGVADMHSKVTDLVHQVTDMIDRPPAKAYLGNCAAPAMEGECATYLFVNLDAENRPPAYVRCPTCLTVHDVAIRQQQLVEQARDVVGTATQISKVLDRIGITIAPSTIRGYAQRRTSRGSIIEPRIRRVEVADDGGQSYYRVNDVMTVYLARHNMAA